MQDEVPRLSVACHLGGMDDPGRDECPALRADSMDAILEPERELAFEDVQRLGVSDMDMRRRRPPTASGTYSDHGKLLEVGEERHVELSAPEDELAFADLDHLPAA